MNETVLIRTKDGRAYMSWKEWQEYADKASLLHTNLTRDFLGNYPWKRKWRAGICPIAAVKDASYRRMAGTQA